MKFVVRKWFHRLKVEHPVFEEEVPTQDEFRKECDINFIVERWKKGISPPAWMTSKTPHYGDFSKMPQSFDEAYRLVEAAEEAFNSLPLGFRHELDHDPRNLDKAPKELFERFGLLSPQKHVDSVPAAPKGAGVDREAPDPVSKPSKKASKESSSDSD